MTKTPQKKKTSRSARMTFYVLLIGVVAVICYYPVAKYFFLQDDFILLANAVFDPGTAWSRAFGGESDLFRPLTKVLYFGVMHGIFGLNALPYHLVSFLVHALNIILIFTLLRRFHIDRLSSLVATSLFALHLGFFDVIAWISCIQQLLGQTFVLAGLILGIRFLDARRPALLALALVSYAFSLLSLEQTYPLALLLLLYAYQKERMGSAGTRARRALRETLPFLTLMVLYLAYMALSKGVPGEGPYQYHFGANVFRNLLTYLDWVFAVSVVMPFIVDVSPSGLTAAHVLLAVIVIYNLAKGRKRIVVFAGAYYLLTILPALFLEGHTFYLHNYVPAVGVVLLVAPVVEDLLAVVRHWRQQMATATASILIVLAGVICFTKVRTNETNLLRPDLPLPKDFVLRRAVIAKNAFDDLSSKTRSEKPPRNLFMVYTAARDWYKDNVVAALGEGAALKLFYSEPDLNVAFYARGDTLYGYSAATSKVFFFDYMGRCFTPEEIRAREGSPVKPTDSK